MCFLALRIMTCQRALPLAMILRSPSTRRSFSRSSTAWLNLSGLGSPVEIYKGLKDWLVVLPERSLWRLGGTLRSAFDLLPPCVEALNVDAESIDGLRDFD